MDNKKENFFEMIDVYGSKLSFYKEKIRHKIVSWRRNYNNNSFLIFNFIFLFVKRLLLWDKSKNYYRKILS